MSSFFSLIALLCTESALHHHSLGEPFFFSCYTAVALKSTIVECALLKHPSSKFKLHNFYYLNMVSDRWNMLSDHVQFDQVSLTENDDASPGFGLELDGSPLHEGMD